MHSDLILVSHTLLPESVETPVGPKIRVFCTCNWANLQKVGRFCTCNHSRRTSNPPLHVQCVRSCSCSKLCCTCSHSRCTSNPRGLHVQNSVAPATPEVCTCRTLLHQQLLGLHVQNSVAPATPRTARAELCCTSNPARAGIIACALTI